jgi:4-amino-4-deoxy-L-arabinose transferase-like glycosyltransferase
MQPGLWVDEIFSLAMATGHSLEHPAADADPTLGDYIEPSSAQLPSEFASYLQHEEPPAGARRVIRAVLLSDTSPPLYYLLLNLWTRAAGTSDAALRLFSTVFALACFPLLWSLGQQIGGRGMAWIVCILFSFSPPALYYSAEGRMYSLVWFLAVALAWSTFELARRGPRLHLFVLWTLSAAAGMLTHYFFVFVLMACFVWLFFDPGKISRVHLAAAFTLVGLLALPWYLQLPETLSRWRITAGWLDYPLTWKQVLTAPAYLAWSFLSGFGVWGGSKWMDYFAAALYAILGIVIIRQGLSRLIFDNRQLLWLWFFGACLGPLAFDLLRKTNASLVARYALPGLPAGLLLAAMAINWLPPSRPWEPFAEVGARLTAWAEPSDLIIVHSIPSGVLGVARYAETKAALASWVVQLEQRSIPSDMHTLLSARRRVALVKIHYMEKSSPAEVWLREHTTLEDEDRLNPYTEILYFQP